MQTCLISLNVDQLQQVKDLAGVFFTPKEIARILEIKEDSFILDCDCEGNDNYKAFQSGRLKAEFELRTSVLKMARAGSSPAQTMALDLLKQSKAKMLDR